MFWTVSASSRSERTA
jgi:hypothetical protein